MHRTSAIQESQVPSCSRIAINLRKQEFHVACCARGLLQRPLMTTAHFSSSPWASASNA